MPDAPVVAVVPLDDRSVNYECVRLLGQAAGFDLRLPPKAWLGTPQRVGAMDRLATWLQAEAQQAAALVVAVDALAYGGLVGSRRSPDSAETVLARLALLRQLKQQRPALTILAFNALMRVNRGNEAEEEKAYWAQWGTHLFRLSVLEDRQAMAVATPAEELDLARLRAETPPAVVADYRGGRARNHAVNRTMIEWTAAGVFDYLIVPQDDTVAYGWNIAEARALRLLAHQLGVDDRVSIYPGTDETTALLLARVAAQRAGLRPRVWLRFSGAGSDQVVTAYEDRPLPQLVKAHLGPLAGVLVDNAAAADLLLFVNGPAEEQGNGPDQWPLLLTDAERAALPPAAQAAVDVYLRQPGVAGTRRELHTVRRDLPEFVRCLHAALASEASCAVVDVAYVNASDVQLGDLLVQGIEVAGLAAYGGWNTAGNTLGSVLAHAVIRHLQRQQGAAPAALAAHVKLLFWRLVEDYLYMGRLRSEIMLTTLPALETAPRLTDLGDHAAAVRAIVEQRLAAAARDLAQRSFVGRTVAAADSRIVVTDLRVAAADLPWDRLFDLTLAIELT